MALEHFKILFTDIQELTSISKSKKDTCKCYIIVYERDETGGAWDYIDSVR